MEGTLEDTDSSISFPEDFLFHVHFLLVVPFLILIEKVVDRSFIGYVKNTDDLIPNSQQDSFNRLVRRLQAYQLLHSRDTLAHSHGYIYHFVLGRFNCIEFNTKLFWGWWWAIDDSLLVLSISLYSYFSVVGVQVVLEMGSMGIFFDPNLKIPTANRSASCG